FSVPHLLPYRALGCPHPSLQFFGRVHGLAAVGGSAVAGGFIVVAVVEVVVVGEFFAGGDVANGFNPDATSNFVGFAIRVAGVVEEHGHSVAVDDDGAVADAEQIGGWRVLVFGVGEFLGNARAGVFDD